MRLTTKTYVRLKKDQLDYEQPKGGDYGLLPSELFKKGNIIEVVRTKLGWLTWRDVRFVPRHEATELGTEHPAVLEQDMQEKDYESYHAPVVFDLKEESFEELDENLTEKDVIRI